jgi:diguanylate cyclase (GGDEF)-like protein
MNRSSLSLSRRLFYSHLACAVAIALAVAAYLYWAIRNDLIAANRHRLTEDAAEIVKLVVSLRGDNADEQVLLQLDTQLKQSVASGQLSAASLWRKNQRIAGTDDSKSNLSEDLLFNQVLKIADGSSVELILAMDSSSQSARLGEIRTYALLGFIGAVVLSFLFARLLSKRIDNSVNTFVERIQEITSGRFDARIQEVSDDHFGRLAQAFNDMSERLQRTLGERERTLEQLRVARDRLEGSMRDRTKELIDLNELLRKEHEQRAQMEASLAEAAATDSQTKLLNRRSMLELLRQIGEVMRKTGKNCSFAILDVDHFKQVNDRFGHDVGDQVLIGISQVIRSHMRADEAAARWGGEEFLLAWPDQNIGVAEQRADRLRELISDCHFANGGLRVTASIGVAQWLASEDMDAALRRADKALYSAKAEGRNKVRVQT